MANTNPIQPKTLSPIQENYLEIIFLAETRTGPVKPSFIAEQAKVSRSSVTSALKNLHSLGLIHYEPYSAITLTRGGKEIGREIYHRHLICQEFFEHILQISPEQADSVACELEHVIPQNVIRRLGQFILFLQERKSEWANWQDIYLNEAFDKKHKTNHLLELKASGTKKDKQRE